ncbi:hypothetical protein GGR26_001777 [Lewinella marina]|uniref:Photosystem I assembly protein Ycf4 n=1 Tax=Neolewinella marina TaxID=438751 RepID=A0A2G0CDH4_9BACT|nr:hypothetical protein [Neolewinella marina]NJB86009.1 hypothetical protein [Neolewinella marina]PHK98024.1 hypothetical protein CGL56_12600 [Neolewinella marina]
MAKTYFKEEQRFRNPGIIALLLLMSSLVLYRVVVTIFNGVTVYDTTVTGLIALFVALGWYGVYSSRLRIKVSKKHLKVRTRGLVGSRLKLPTKEMADCSFVDVTPSARWSGALVDPSSRFQCIDFGGRRGLCIRMRDGRSYFIGSDGLFEQRHDIPLPTHASAS